MTRRQSHRRGYALILVMVFVVLFSAILGVAWRRVASALRIENVSEVRRQCDEGSIPVLAQAMKVLETRLCWDAASPALKLNGSTESEISYGKTVGEGENAKYYKITFTRTVDFNPATGLVDWSVSVTILTIEQYALEALPDFDVNFPSL